MQNLTTPAIIDKIAHEQKVEELVNNISPFLPYSDRCDLIQDIYLSLLEDKKTPELYERGELDYYIIKIIKNQVFSTSSPFYNKYMRSKRNENIDDRCDI